MEDNEHCDCCDCCGCEDTMTALEFADSLKDQIDTFLVVATELIGDDRRIPRAEWEDMFIEIIAESYDEE